jgi:hypothetical protein
LNPHRPRDAVDNQKLPCCIGLRGLEAPSKIDRIREYNLLPCVSRRDPVQRSRRGDTDPLHIQAGLLLRQEFGVGANDEFRVDVILELSQLNCVPISLPCAKVLGLP